MTKKDENIAIVDADSLIFYSSKDTIEDSIIAIKQKLSDILTATEADKFILCLTGGRNNFRYDLYPDYKSARKNRKVYSKPLKYLKTLKAFLIEEYNSLLIQSLEADDIVAYLGQSLNTDTVNAIICSPDKDVVFQLPGKHWNYQYKVINKGKPTEKLIEPHWVTTTQAEGDRFFALQMLMGDPGDSIPGLLVKTDYMKERFGLDARTGIGEKTAEKILDVIDKKYSGNYAKEILDCYISKFGEIKDIEAQHLGFEDYTMNRHLLQLNTQIGTFNKILDTYDIEPHINTVVTINVNSDEIIEDF